MITEAINTNFSMLFQVHLNEIFDVIQLRNDSKRRLIHGFTEIK